MRSGMKALVGIGLLSGATMVGAGDFSCRTDKNTDRHYCYKVSELRVNGTTREFKLYTGGENGVENKGGIRVRITCLDNVVIELRDRDGIVFARNVPQVMAMRYLREDACAEKVKRVGPPK